MRFMIFRQLFDATSSTYTYLLASRVGGEALIIDSVLERVDRYLQLFEELDLKLVKAIDTHVHADHITGLGALRDRTRCITVMGAESDVDVVSMRVADGDKIEIEGIDLTALYTPGHTADSYSFHCHDRVFTGDTLLIRGTGRTDFQNGSSKAQYHSLFSKLLTLPEETLVYPGHDYKGDTVSTIAEERAFNPRLQVSSEAEYVDIMENLNLPNPKLMDVAVPANLKIGFSQEEVAAKGWSLECTEVADALGSDAMLLVDLRDANERQQHGVIPHSVHAPYGDLDENIHSGGLLYELTKGSQKKLVFYCAYGERSAMAVKAAQEAGLNQACHLEGGIDAWRQADGVLEIPA
jgi:glyoxylase-like metal-dependent hydrolase (beta-lactamase superfamily II)/rhodanese-related sulfurtransferase